jgi:hypothetical protein
MLSYLLPNVNPRLVPYSSPLLAPVSKLHVVCTCVQATRDYCQGQPPDPTAATAAGTLGFSINSTSTPAAAATAAVAAADAAAGSSSSNGASGVHVFNPLEDIVAADMVLVMDKYTAADVLREVRAVFL